MMMGGHALHKKGKRSLLTVIRTLLLIRQTGNAALCATTCRYRLKVGSFFWAAANWVLGNRPRVADPSYFVANTNRCHDRAAVLTTAIFQIFETAPPQDRQQAVEDYLRDELSDAVRQAVADVERTDA
jgi:hypothetical protein